MSLESSPSCGVAVQLEVIHRLQMIKWHQHRHRKAQAIPLSFEPEPRCWFVIGVSFTLPNRTPRSTRS